MTQNGHKIIIPGGYYLKARKIQNSAIQKQPPHVREIWDWLLKEANHKDKEYNGFMIKRGQLFRTYDEIREGLHWMIGYRKMMYTKDHTKKAMKFLRKHQMIATKKALGGVLITILNYNYYQNPKNYESTNESHIESTNEAPMKHHESPHYNKNDKNEKNNISAKIYDFYIELLNPKYKTRVGSIEWIKRRLKLHIPDDLKKAIENYKNDLNGSEYVKDPRNFFGRDKIYHDFLPGNYVEKKKKNEYAPIPTKDPVEEFLKSGAKRYDPATGKEF